MPTYKTSEGEVLEKSVIDSRILQAKAEYSEFFLNRHGYIFCERCKKNKFGCKGIARSHVISVDECQKTGRAELAYCITNLEHLGEKCHRDIEANSHAFREAWYHARLKGHSYEEFVFYWEKDNQVASH